MREFDPGQFVLAIVYALLGIVMFFGAFWVVDRLHPADFWKELLEEKNLALAIVLGAMSLGICIIIAAAVH